MQKTREIEAWLIRPDEMSSEPAQATALHSLDPTERARAARFVFDIDRTRYVARHSAYRQVLAHRLGCSAREITYEVSTRGKPSLSGAGQGRLHFNASSCGELALIVLDEVAPIGADIEAPRLNAKLAPLARAYYSSDECASCVTADGTVSIELFLRIWTRKEAFLKLTGLGLVDDLPQVRVGTGESVGTGHYVEPGGSRLDAQLHTQPVSGTSAMISIAAPIGAPFAVRLIEYRHEALQGNA